MPSADLASVTDQHASLVDLAYSAVREAIVHGQFPAGGKLVESRLSSDLGVSRPPIREALRRLSQEGLVVDKPRRGAFVRQLEASDLVDIYNLRMAVESTACRLVVLMEADITGLTERQERMAAAASTGDVEGVIDADLDFHQHICELAQNEPLMRTFKSVSGHVRMALAINDRAYDNLEDVAGSHDAIVDALRRRNAPEAAVAVEAHIHEGAVIVLGSSPQRSRLLSRR